MKYNEILKKRILCGMMAMLTVFSLTACGSSTALKNAPSLTGTMMDAEDYTTDSEFYADLENVLEGIYNVRAGSAGSSMRIAVAADDLSALVESYGQQVNKEIVAQLTASWSGALKGDSTAEEQAAFLENFAEVQGYLKNEKPKFVKKAAYKAMVAGITEGINGPATTIENHNNTSDKVTLK